MSSALVCGSSGFASGAAYPSGNRGAFVLPGGNRAAAACHLARTVCRRAERRAWAAAKLAALNPELLRYLNRLSDLLFVVARVLARENGGQETLWKR